MNPKIQAKEYIQREEYGPALNILMDLLDEDPNDPDALFLFGSVAIAQNKRGLAYNIYARCAKYAPENPSVWINFGRCQSDDEEGWKDSEWCFKKALEYNPQAVAAMSNLAALNVQKCNVHEAKKWAKRALKIDPNYQSAISSLAFAYLMEGKWEKGWKMYAAMLGTQNRLDTRYNDLPMWDGSPGKTVVVYGEQGVGDEILYASVLPDMAKDCKIIYDTMPRLERLMKRSLPNVYVTGSRWENEISLPKDWDPDASIPLAGICQYYRKKDADYPGTQYIEADPMIRKSMRGLLDSLGQGLKVGIAWKGGSKNTRGHFRTHGLEDMLPIVRTPGVEFVSLHYNDPSEEISEFEEKRGIKIHHFPWITEGKDHDMTAALVAELDLVIAVPTSATQLAGAMGVETWVLVPETTGWLFYRDVYPWAKSVSSIHNWKAKEVGDKLKAKTDRKAA